MKAEYIITDNEGEKITVKWDGERFGIIEDFGSRDRFPVVIILNPREAHDLASFINSQEVIK